MGHISNTRRTGFALATAFMLMAATVAQVPPLGGESQAAATLAPMAGTATIGGSIFEGSVYPAGSVKAGLPVMAPDADSLSGASVMVQNQHSGGAVITYGTVDPTAPGNTWTATVPPGDYVVMFSAPGHDLTSREFTVAAGDVKSKDAYLPPMPLDSANLLYYSFYDNYVNGEDDAPADPPMNGVTLTASDEDGSVLATGVTGSQASITFPDGTLITNTDGLYYFTGLPSGEVVVTADPSTAYSHAQPTDPVTGSELGTSWGSSTEFYLMTSEEGGHAWDPTLYPGDPGTEAGAYMIWHGFVEKLGALGSPGNPNPADTITGGTITGTLIDADSIPVPPDPAEPWPIPGENHPGVTLNTVVPDGFVVLYTNAETSPVHPVATVDADPTTGEFRFDNVPPGSYKLFLSDNPIDYVWNQAQVRVAPGQTLTVNPLVPRFFARAQGHVYDDSTSPPTPIAGATVNLRYKSGAVKKTTTTDVDGWYNFDNLPEIEVLGFVDVELAPGYRGVIRSETFYPGGEDPAHPNYVTPVVKTFNAMNRYVQWYTANYEADFYLEPVPASTGDIAGFVWDENLAPGTWTPDGTYDPDKERTLHDVTVELWNAAGTTRLGSTTTGTVDEVDLEGQGWIPPYTAHLDEAGGVFVGPMPGYYEFRDLAPGTYQVKMILPDGFFASPSGSDMVTVTVAGGGLAARNFGANTLVPQAGEIEGGVFDDVNLDTNPASLLFEEKAGIPGVPIGVYDQFGYFLGSANMGNPLCYVGSPAGACPAGEAPIQKPEMERRVAPGPHIYLGNDPSLPDHNPNYLPLALAYQFDQGQFKFEADWSLIPTAAIGLGGPLPAGMPLVAVNSPVVDSAATVATAAAGSFLTIIGSDFGPTKDGGTVTLSGKQLEVVSWSDPSIVVKVALDAVSGPLLIATSTGISNSTTITVTAPLTPASFGLLAASPSDSVYVDASNSGPADGSAAKPWPTIREALGHLPTLPVDTPRNVMVAPGTYRERVHITESDVRIIGAGPHETTIDATSAATFGSQGIPNGGGPVVYIGQGPIAGPVRNITISGFTITGGSVADEIGAGIFAGLHNRGIDINNNMIVRNGGYYGGGIWFHKSVHDVSIWSNTIAENGNMGGYGGGISVNDEPEDPAAPEHTQPEHTVDDALNTTPPGTYEIYNNLIFHNVSADYGGGIALYEVKDRLEVHDNMILENIAQDHGGGMFVEDSGPIRVYDNVFMRNFSPDDGGAISFEDVADGTSASVVAPNPSAASHQVEVFNNLFAENIADDHGENNARGGAIALDDTLDADIHHNTIVGNIAAGSEAPAGGAIDSERNGHEYNGESAPWISPGFSDPLIHDNILWDNWLLSYDQPNDGAEEDLNYTWGSNYHWTPNQIHVDSPTLQQQWQTASNSFSLNHVDNNLIGCGYPSGANNLDSDPMFVDPSSFDWSLAAGSPAAASGYGTSTHKPIPTGILGEIVMPARDPSATGECPPNLITPSPSTGGSVAGSTSAVTAEPGDHHVIVSWSPYIPTGTQTVIGYTVSATPGTASCVTVGPTNTSCDVDGLTNFDQYLFTAVANTTGGNELVGSVTATPVGASCDRNPDTGFLDIAESFAESDIACISHLNLTTGTSDTTYTPRGEVSREQMAAFLARLWRALSSAVPGGADPFDDIDESFAAADIVFIYNLGITAGTSVSTFSPRWPVTRQQMAAFLALVWRNLGGVCDISPTPFADIASSFAAEDIACIYNLGITTGTSRTTYSPARVVSREQAAAFLARLWQAATDWGL